MPPVLAGGEVGQVPVLRGRPDGRVQHAPVHPAGVQSDGRQGKPLVCRTGAAAVPLFTVTPTFISRRAEAQGVKQYFCGGW